ncbi:MAG: tRNA pseudouridine(13) synthase TruD [Gemmatales bacterium]|nr:tRNA pseudouridine(13) synthase TruD [Gemmatales bacterium]MDW8388397.1 tRNA pseudouridine(13) synthase TruD [Gemmatales bacterium]
MDVLFQTPPFQYPDLPGLGGRIRTVPEDFVVEEVPAYLPSGAGQYAYLWVEKRDMSAEYLARLVAKRLGIALEDIGMAGLKDRHAVTRQWISVPVEAEPHLAELEQDGIRVLEVRRHTNKLKPGHLRGNRFTIRIRDVNPGAAEHLPAILDRIREGGLANYYGPQRFGSHGDTLRIGLRLMGHDVGGWAGKPTRFLRKLALSAVQSAVYNLYLTRRIADGLLHTVLPGDVMGLRKHGGLFRAEDVATEQRRLEQREIVVTGPIFGRRMMAPTGEAARREAELLAELGLTPESFAASGKLLEGTRRHNVVWIEDLTGHCEGTEVVLSFTLPAGSYATVLLRELMKQPWNEAEALGGTGTEG